ncbi:hypothetical protein [Clostridium botulinum]|uniref:hypothetical protein n=1 Tax=Clostridium botulinum TaxID=1491 RepID=UPI001C9B0949|nr:hypothetical protein [Clostridium botulinum]MBY6838756.1 hypothetical protein [Clostridium botulinum]
MEDNNSLMYEQKMNKKIDEIVKEHFLDRNFIKALNEELSKKGLNIRLITAMRDGSLIAEDLKEENEEDLAFKIAIFTAYYDVFKDEEFNPKTIFSQNQRIDYNSFRKIKIVLNELELQEIKQVDKYNYEGRISYKKIYESLRDVLVRYNMKAQRDNKVVNAGTRGALSREIDLNKKNVKEIKKLALNHKLEETQIILNLRIADIEEKEYFEPDYEFITLSKLMEEKFDLQKELKDEIENKESVVGNALNSIGRLTIRPNYDLESRQFTVLEVNDGWHRIVAIAQAVAEHYEKTGEWLEGGFAVKIVLRTLKESQEIIRQIFQRSDTNKSFLKSLEHDDFTDFIDMLGDESSILKKKISQTYNEYKIDNKALTHRSILAESVKSFTNVEVQKAGIARGIAKNLAKSIDTIIETIAYKYFNDDLEKMKKETELLDCNMFVGYLAIAYEMFETKNYNYDDIADNLYCLDKNDTKNLKLNEKNVTIKNVYMFFKNLAERVLKVA